MSVPAAEPVEPCAGPALFVGLDVHNDTIAVSLAASDATEVRRYGIIGGTHDDVLKLAKKLAAAHPRLSLKFCYEAGPRGYPLCRFLQSHDYHCILVSPSQVPRKPGDRVKTNRRDADQLARLYRAGEISGIHVPDPQDEAVRDLLRGRGQTIVQQHRARHINVKTSSKPVRIWSTSFAGVPKNLAAAFIIGIVTSSGRGGVQRASRLPPLQECSGGFPLGIIAFAPQCR